MATYDQLGVKRIINAAANNTRLGGCIMDPEVVKAMAGASTWFVDMDQLQRQAGRYIAQITGAEDGLVTSGAACGLLVGTAASITGENRPMQLAIPENIDAEVIIPKGQLTGYHQAVRTAGAKLIEVGLPYRVSIEEMESAITEKTVALCYTFGEVTSKVGMISLQDMVTIGKRFGIPTLVDASVASYPPSRMKEHIECGADLVAFSGAKHIYGPPASGFICGRADLIAACRRQAGPEYGIGRPCKVSKEEIVGLIRALELYLSRDIEAELRVWEIQVSKMIDLLSRLPYLEVCRIFPDEVDRPVPRVEVVVDEASLGFRARDLADYLRDHDPSIRSQEFLLDAGIMILNPLGLFEGDESIIYDAFEKYWISKGHTPG
jgi:uncharacterized pyridoxal phosphate-dependent enzyme